jgi:DNA topoisomerase-1
VLGHDPDTGLPIYVKTGRFGPYVQLGEDDSNGGKPRRGSLWPHMSMETLSLDDALLILSFPRVLGVHPETGNEVTVQDGPNGPYIKSGTDSRSLTDHDHLASVTLEEAVRILAEPRPRGRGASQPSILSQIGEHPVTKLPLTVRKGRFGPYVTHRAATPRK